MVQSLTENSKFIFIISRTTDFKLIGKLQHIVVAFSAPLAFNSRLEIRTRIEAIQPVII